MLASGSCHCHSVLFQVDSEMDRLIKCNCSMCSRRNALMLRLDQNHFRLLEGEDCLTLYQFGSKKGKHYFCRICGIYTHHEIPNSNDIAINSSCLPEVDFSQAKIIYLDGRSF